MKEIIRKDISVLAIKLIEKLSDLNLKITFAESITGGLFASSLTKEKDASKIFSLGLIVYSDETKINLLGVSKDTIKTHSAYSIETVEEMLSGLKKISQADIIISVSGIAGPIKINNHEIGETYLGIMINNKTKVIKKIFTGDRETIQLEIVKFGFTQILNNLL
ncbi:MAG: CinA family protein [Candidatus Izemoplasmatales bacterium]|nr:CinA family protein [Candidatus Izemoplasmatales bacterium]